MRSLLFDVETGEAHPKDGWSFGRQNGRWDINQAKTLEQRRTDCKTWTSSFNSSTKYLVDGMDNAAKMSYMAPPDRLYIIDQNGVVRYQGKSGPFGYDVNEMKMSLSRLL